MINSPAHAYLPGAGLPGLTTSSGPPALLLAPSLLFRLPKGPPLSMVAPRGEPPPSHGLETLQSSYSSYLQPGPAQVHTAASSSFLLPEHLVHASKLTSPHRACSPMLPDSCNSLRQESPDSLFRPHTHLSLQDILLPSSWSQSPMSPDTLPGHHPAQSQNHFNHLPGLPLSTLAPYTI